MADIPASYQQGYAFGTQQRQAREAEQRRNTLANIAQMAYQASPQEREPLIAQAIGTDPDAGFALDKSLQTQQAGREKTLLNTARFLTSAPEQARPAIYQQMLPTLRRDAPQVPWKDAYDAEVGANAAAYLQSQGGGVDLGDRFRVVGNTLVDLQDPTRAVYRAPSVINADEGIFEYDGGGLRPIGAPPMDVVPVQVDPSIPAPVQQMISGQRPWTADTPDIVAGAPRLTPRGSAAANRRLQLQEESATRSAQAAERTAAAAERSEQNTRFQQERDLRKEVSDRVKDPRTILSAYDKVKTTAGNPSAANDIALIFSYMKMLDPGSVVREGEFANAQNAAGVPDQVVNLYNRARSGERLNDAQRAQFTASARSIADSAQRSIDEIATEYRSIAEESGLDPRRATGLDAPRAAGGRAGATRTATNPQTGEKLYLVNGQWVR